MRCEVLSDTLPFEALLVRFDQSEAKTGSSATLSLRRHKSNSNLFWLDSSHSNQALAKDSIEPAIAQLNSLVLELALKELNTTQDALKETSKQALKPKPKKGPKSPPIQQTSPLDPTQQQDAIRLNSEIKDLRSFLQGKPEPGWLAGRIDNSLYKNSLQNFRKAKADLANLETTFLPESQVAIAQRELVLKSEKRLRDDKAQLAKHLLQSYQQDLKRIEQQAYDRIKDNTKILKNREQDSTSQDTKTDTANEDDWFQTYSDLLEKDKDKIRSRATVIQVQESHLREHPKNNAIINLALWVVSGCFLLAALFAPDATKQENAEPDKDKQKFTESLPLPRPEKILPAKTESFQPEPFLLDLIGSIKNQTGRDCQRYLILGSSVSAEARASVAARLARSMSATGRKVRLVDFDFQAKTLSKKLGNGKTAGVSDLLSQGAPVDDFLASVQGTNIEFAPAGRLQFTSKDKAPKNLAELLKPRKEGTLVIDASFSSPLHLVVTHVEAVICTTHPGRKWTEAEQEVLLAIKEAKLPIWGLLQGDQKLFPFT